MGGRRGFELMELLVVKLLLAGVWLAMRGGQEVATASMLEEGLAAIREAGSDAGDPERSGFEPSMGPPLPPSWLEPGEPRFRLDHDRVPQGSGLAKGANPTASLRVRVGIHPFHGG